MRVMVTGSRGFLGKHVTARLVAENHTVIGFDAESGRNILHPDLLHRVMREDNVGHVIHLAGVLGTAELFEDPHLAVNVNVIGTLNVLQACQRANAGYTGITMPRVWDNVYQATKGCADAFARAWWRHYDIPVSFVRAFNAFGPGQKLGPVQKIVPTFADAAWRGQPLPVWGDGLQQVDLVHARDVAECLVRAMDFGGAQVFDAGCGEGRSVLEVAELVSRIAEKPLRVEHYPMRQGEHEAKVVAEGDGWDLMGWRPEFRYADLEETVLSYR